MKQIPSKSIICESDLETLINYYIQLDDFKFKRVKRHVVSFGTVWAIKLAAFASIGLERYMGIICIPVGTLIAVAVILLCDRLITWNIHYHINNAQIQICSELRKTYSRNELIEICQRDCEHSEFKVPLVEAAKRMFDRSQLWVHKDFTSEIRKLNKKALC